MSGHSKWATTKRQKGAADAKRGALFTKLANAITVAARHGGGDQEANFKLRLTIDLAKSANMPKENIERAIKRGTGELAGGTIESVVYEGYGPAGIAMMIECLTDNRNRTSSAIKHLFNKYGGSMGGPNSVGWMFQQLGVIGVDALSDEFELELIDAGVTDIKRSSDRVTIYAAANTLQKIKELLDSKKIPIRHAEIEWVAHELKELADEEKSTVEKFFDELDEDQDVNNFYSNVKD